MATFGANLLWLVPGKVGGSEQYATRLLTAVEPLLSGSHDLKIYCNQDFVEAHPAFSDFNLVVSPVTGQSKALRIMAENSWLAKVSSGDDVVHHFGGMVPLARTAPPIVTIHDLQPLDIPENFSTIKRIWMSQMLPRTARAARMVITPSEFTRNSVLQRFGLQQERVRVVSQGLDPVIKAGTPSFQPAERFGSYVLYPAISYPHKNHQDLIEAIATLARAGFEIKCIFTGVEGPQDAYLRRLASELGVANQVVFLGRVPTDDLAALYSQAVATVFPSSYEGFGNPVLEAMAHGCPVISSDAGALPEVLGDAGLMFSVGDGKMLAQHINTVATDRLLVEDLVARGLKQANQYCEKDSGENLASIYEEALTL